MNRRILKKQCKRAMAILIAEHGFRRDQFELADGDETVDSPTNMPARQMRHCFLHPGPLPGTPLFWEHDYWSQDADARLASDVLCDIIAWNYTSFPHSDA